jgi:hypothetical protein
MSTYDNGVRKTSDEICKQYGLSIMPNWCGSGQFMVFNFLKIICRDLLQIFLLTGHLIHLTIS